MPSKNLEISEFCKTPSEVVLRDLLDKQADFNPLERDFLKYVSGFTHADFANNLLSTFEISVSNMFPVIMDRINRTLYVKIIINDLSKDITSLDPIAMSKTYNTQILANNIALKKINNGFVKDFRQEIKGLTYDELNEYLSLHDPGLYEEVVFYEEQVLHIPDWKRLVLGIACIPHRNTYENLERFFNRVCAAIICNDADDIYNLSIKHLQERSDLFHLLKKIKWYVIEKNSPSVVVDFLNSIGASSTLLPYVGDNANYLSQPINEIKSRIYSNF